MTILKYQFVIFEVFGVDSVWVVDTSVVLHHSDATSARSSQVATTVKTHVTEALQVSVRSIYTYHDSTVGC